MSNKKGKYKRIVVIRNSPDWGACSDLWMEDGIVAESLFLPSPLPPGFPDNTVSLISKWNAIFQKNYFLTRQEIKQVSFSNILSVGADRIVSQEYFTKHLDDFDDGSLLYLIDDDDFAIPGLFDIVEPHFSRNTDVGCVRWSSISIGDQLLNRRVERSFPRLRPWLLYQAELRPNKLGFLSTLLASRANIPGAINQLSIGALHTNNYILKLTNSNRASICNYLDHVIASKYIWRSKIKIISLERQWLSFTNKHPASITAFSKIVQSSESDEVIVSHVSNYIMKYGNLSFSGEIKWMEEFHDILRKLYGSIIK